MAERLQDRAIAFFKEALCLSACLALFCTFLGPVHGANAQVEIDTTALGSLDNYQPPPMFGAAPPVEVNPLPDNKTHPNRQPATSPVSEDLLAQPVKNLHVFTRQMDLTPKPVPTTKNIIEPLLPLPDAISEAREENTVETAPPPIPLRKKVKQETTAKNNKVPELQNIPVTAPAIKSASYKPKAPQTMPAVPSGEVEKVALASATLPPSGNAVKTENKVVLDFTGSRGLELQQGQKDKLTRMVIARIKDSVQRVLIVAYAASTDGTESTARRLSLSRALSVRDFLIESSVDSGRIDVRAMANKTDSSPADRVDIVF